nr:hypothetical protein [Micavibrio sp.]
MTDQSATPASPINSQATTGETHKLLTGDGVKVVAIEDLENPQSIEKPVSGETSAVSVEAGQDYILSFAEDEMSSFVQEGDALTINFNDGSTLIVNNFVTSTASSDAAHLVFQGVDGVNGLLANQVVDTTPDENLLEDPQTDVRKELQESVDIAQSEIAEQIVAEISPAAGQAGQLAQIEPAAGDAPGEPGEPQNSGFTFNDPTTTPVGPLSAIGPIGPTLLNYGVDYRNDIVRPEDEFTAPADDQPIIIDPAALNFDETNLVGGVLSQNDTLNVDFGNDGPGTIAPNDTFDFSGSATGGTLTSNGVAVNVTATADGYVGEAGGSTVFTLTIDPATGEYTFTLNGVLDHADGTDPNDVITLDFGVTATDSDGDEATATIKVNVADDAPVTPADDAFTVDEDNLGPIVINDSLNADFGQDGAGAVTPSGDSSFSGVTALTAGGVPVTINTTANGYEGLAGGTKVFDITFDAATGDYTFTLHAPLDHDAPGSDTITVNFGAKVTDYDGDSATGTITVNITDSVPKFGDTPVIGKGIETVDETNFTATGTSVSGALDVDFGEDGGVISTTNDFQSTGSLAGGALTSGGQGVDVTATATGYTGTINGGADTVFTITVDAATGAYTYTQVLPFDHADGANPNDQITLQFGVRVTDGDGDTDDGQITVHVLDDAPSISSPVTHSVYEQDVDTTPQSVSGNLTVDFGEDGAGDVHPTGTTSFNGVPALTSNGEAITVTATTNGYVGTLTSGGKAFEITIDAATGAYTFIQFEALDHATGSNELTLNFGVDVVDYDGDSAATNIAIKVKDSTPEIGDKPTVGKGIETVDETNLPGGVEANGKIDVNFGSDLPGSLNLTGTTSSSTTLTHEGQAVTVTAVAGGYVGTVNAGTKTIFTLDVNSQTGEYSFKLLDTLDHPNAADPNDAIQIKFGVVAVDHDGDTDLGDITINVLDDGPIAHDDFNHYDTTNGGANGNVITGLNGGAGAADELSKDNGADEAHDHDVVQVSFKGNVVDVPAGGFA